MKIQHMRKFFTIHKREITASNIIKICIYISLPLVLLVALVIICSTVFLGTMSTDVNQVTGFWQTMISFSLPMILSMCVLPLVVLCKTENLSLTDIGLTFGTHGYRITIIIACVSFLSVIVASTIKLWLGYGDLSHTQVLTMLFQFAVVALSEEIMMRSIIYHESSKIFAPIANCLFSGLVFAFIYHSNEIFLINLGLRFPLGVLLCYLRYKTRSVFPSIAFHWAYDMFVISFI